MIKEAIDFIASMSNGKILEGAGKLYSRHTLEELPSPDPLASPVHMHTLSGLAAYIHNDEFDDTSGYAVFVESPDEVLLRSCLHGDFRQRETIVIAEPFKVTPFPFGRYLQIEPFIVGLQSCFVQDEATAAISKLVGNLQSEAVQTLVDDGVTQQATVRCGVAKVGNVTVPNPVSLRPFRTFADIEQPPSSFVLRLRRSGDDGLPEAALFEVVDNQWKLAAVAGIKRYLDDLLEGIPVFA